MAINFLRNKALIIFISLNISSKGLLLTGIEKNITSYSTYIAAKILLNHQIFTNQSKHCKNPSRFHNVKQIMFS